MTVIPFKKIDEYSYLKIVCQTAQHDTLAAIDMLDKLIRKRTKANKVSAMSYLIGIVAGALIQKRYPDAMSDNIMTLIEAFREENSGKPAS